MDQFENKFGMLTKDDIKDKYFYNKIKRMIDIVGAVIGIILLIPVFILISCLIKIDDPKGSIFFTQVRVGKNEKKFKMYKFRSMCFDAEEKLQELLKLNEIDGAMFKIKDDPRVTKIGKFIRKTSIDELPQLLNVLKGEMTLVGPRPPLPREVIDYTEYDKQRLLVVPGCTGLWQISGRNNTGFKDMVELDIKYINNLSVYNDLQIIVKTICVLISGHGAY
ncbi:sugar transferase [Carnobacterium divergens]|uniref:sugar transferase n=1 Tax=Carnobacterium divergens TaxID=2748 RepID=UPI0039B0BA03